MGQIERVALKCVIAISKIEANGKLLYNTGDSIWCSVDNLEEWDGVGGGREVQGGGNICPPITDSC